MYKQVLATALFAILTSAVTAEPRSADEIIARIDSSGWKVDPMDFGMTAMEYQRKEADLIFQDMISRSGLNEFYHFGGLSKAADTWVVTPNVDTVYSVAVIDAREDFSIELPEVGDRFISIHVQDQNHTFVDYNWDSGLHEYVSENIDTDYVIVGIRVGTDATQKDVNYITHVLQPKMIIKAKSSVPFKTDTTDEAIVKLRDALLVEWGNLPDMYNSVQFDINEVNDWEKWTYTIAGSWGLSPESTAMYASWARENTKANQCYIATFDKVPAEAFASLTMYNEDNYLMTDDYNVVSTGRDSFKENEDGSFTIVFGGKDCKKIAEKRAVNFAFTPVDGWRAQIRAYKPNVESMKKYTFPELKQLD